MQISKWGNSLAIRLRAAVVEALGLREGDDITLHAAGRRALEIEKTPDSKELLARLRKFRGRLPKDFKFDRLEANVQALGFFDVLERVMGIEPTLVVGGGGGLTATPSSAVDRKGRKP
jgi:antitoxin MazE